MCWEGRAAMKWMVVFEKLVVYEELDAGYLCEEEKMFICVKRRRCLSV